VLVEMLGRGFNVALLDGDGSGKTEVYLEPSPRRSPPPGAQDPAA
jgi:hypothetical protein